MLMNSLILNQKRTNLTLNVGWTKFHNLGEKALKIQKKEKKKDKNAIKENTIPPWLWNR